MRWDTHFNKVTLNVPQCIGILYILKDSLPHSALILLYNSFMLSYLNYCVAVWGNCCQTKLDKLFKLQKKALRICLNITLNIFDLYFYSLALLGFFYFQNKLPFHISKMFTLNYQIHNHNTRFKDSFHLWPVKTNNIMKSVRHNFPVIWNSIPIYILKCKSMNSF